MSIIKLRGLPWSCIEEDIVKFLEGVKIQEKEKQEEDNAGGESKSDVKMAPAIYLTTNSEGRPSGEAFIELVDEEDVENALKRNNALMGQRYIEVFRSNSEQLSKHLRESKNNASNWSDPVIRLRGLPYNCTMQDITTFFDGLNIAYGGILMVIDFSGRFNGEAFVQFANILDAQKALDKHKQKIGNRYIEIFRSTFEEMQYYSSNSNSMNGRYSSKMGRNDNGDGNNRNRNKPYSRNSNIRRDDISFNGNRNNCDYGLPSLMSNNNFNRNNNNNNSYFGDGGYQRSFYNFVNGNYGNTSQVGSLMNNLFNNYSYGEDENDNDNGNGNDNDNGYDDDYNDDNYNQDRSDFILKMRGLPYSTTEEEIRNFFSPLNPVRVEILRNREKRPSGEAECDFASYDDLNEAMKFDKKHIGSRYIELFLVCGSKDDGNVGGNRHGKGGSINSLMGKNFGTSFSNNGSHSRSQNGKFSHSLNGQSDGTNIQPLLNMMPPLPPLPPPPPPPPPPPSSQQSSVYSTNINEMLMADMAKKMFSAYGQSQMYQQYNQQQKFSGSINRRF